MTVSVYNIIVSNVVNMRWIFMLLKSAYYEKRKSFAKNSKRLIVLSAGQTQLKNLDMTKTFYKDRQDFQFIYINEGCIHFFNQDGSEYVVDKGNLVLLKPHEYQNYDIYKKENPDVYWCHFSGYFVENLLNNYNINDMSVIPTSKGREYRRLFTAIRLTLENASLHYIEMCALLLEQLMITISNDKNNKNDPKKNYPEVFANVLEYIQEHYYENITIEKLAEMNFSSKITLTRQFEKYINCSPKKYLNQLRIHKAQTLLLQTEYKINEIAFMVGYQDPLYFSTAFHAETGLSPRDFRNTIKKGKITND